MAGTGGDDDLMQEPKPFNPTCPEDLVANHPDIFSVAADLGLDAEETTRQIDDAINRMADPAFVCSSMGSRMGDPLACHVACGRAHEISHEVNADHPTTIFLSFADDNALTDDNAPLMDTFGDRGRRVWRKMRHRSHQGKLGAAAGRTGHGRGREHVSGTGLHGPALHGSDYYDGFAFHAGYGLLVLGISLGCTVACVATVVFG